MHSSRSGLSYFEPKTKKKKKKKKKWLHHEGTAGRRDSLASIFCPSLSDGEPLSGTKVELYMSHILSGQVTNFLFLSDLPLCCPQTSLEARQP